MRRRHVLRVALIAVAGLILFACASVRDRRLIESQKYLVSMDYGGSIEDLVRAGNYSRANSEINSQNFPTDQGGSRELTMTLIRLEPRTRTPLSTLVAEQEKKGLRAATISELLFLGKTYPELPGSLSIVGLGSYKNYMTITYQDFGMSPDGKVEMRYVQRFYPCLVSGLFGRSVTLMQEDMIPSYNLGGFYACFVDERSPAEE